MAYFCLRSSVVADSILFLIFALLRFLVLWLHFWNLQSLYLAIFQCVVLYQFIIITCILLYFAILLTIFPLTYLILCLYLNLCSCFLSLNKVLVVSMRTTLSGNTCSEHFLTL